jgi:hypothetical protein
MRCITIFVCCLQSRRLRYVPVAAVGDECSKAAADSSKSQASSVSCSAVQEGWQTTHAFKRPHTGGSVRIGESPF